jgi:trans-aconitate 2-methyltransferase
VTFLEADLASLAVPSPVDVVFSTATFHWVLDHDALFRALAGALRPGGRLLAQCGGAGNLARVHARAGALQAREPYAEHFAGWTEPWCFATPEATLARLARAGFVGARAWLEPAPTPFPSAEALGEFLTAVVLRPHLSRLPEALRGAFVGELVARAGADPEGYGLDYVRLNLEAVRE